LKKIELVNFSELRYYKLDAIYNGVSEHFKPVTELQESKRQSYPIALFLFFLGNTDPKKKH
jgi:hypothetical protein